MDEKPKQQVMEGIDDAVSAALRLLGSSDGSDEAGVAALLLLSKGASREAFEGCRAEIAAAMPENFLARMLSAEQQPLRALGAAVLTSLVADGSRDVLEGPKGLRKLTPALLAIIAEESFAKDAKEEFKVDVIGSALRIASRGRRALLLPRKVQHSLIRVLWDSEELSADLANKLLFVSDGLADETLEEITFALGKTATIKRTKVFFGLSDLVAKDLQKRKQLQSVVVGNLSKAVFKVLRSGRKAPLQYRLQVLKIAASLFDIVGGNWPSTGEGVLGENVVFVLKVCSIEVNVILTDLRYALVEQTNELPEPELKEKLETLLACMSILESSVGILTSDDGSIWEVIDPNDLLQCRDALTESFSSIEYFICFVRRQHTDSISKPLVREIMRACGKCLGCWLSDGPSDAIGEIENAELENVSKESGGLDTVLYLISKGLGETHLLRTINVWLEQGMCTSFDVHLAKCRSDLVREMRHLMEGLDMSKGENLSTVLDVAEFMNNFDEKDIADWSSFLKKKLDDFKASETRGALLESGMDGEFFALQVEAAILLLLIESSSSSHGCLEETRNTLQRGNELKNQNPELHSAIFPLLTALLSSQ